MVLFQFGRKSTASMGTVRKQFNMTIITDYIEIEEYNIKVHLWIGSGGSLFSMRKFHIGLCRKKSVKLTQL